MKKILITGPESSGKTTLARKLAQQYQASWVPEYARTYLSLLGRPYEAEDLLAILKGQLWQEYVAGQADVPFLFCDTGPEVIYVWSMVKYGEVDPMIQDALQGQQYDQRWLCYPDLEWSPDPLREAPELNTRLVLFEQYEALFQQFGWSYRVIKGERTHVRV